MQSSATLRMDSMALSATPKVTTNEDIRRSSDRELTFMPPDYLRRVSPDRMKRHLEIITAHPGYPLKTFVRASR